MLLFSADAELSRKRAIEKGERRGVGESSGNAPCHLQIKELISFLEHHAEVILLEERPTKKDERKPKSEEYDLARNLLFLESGPRDVNKGVEMLEEATNAGNDDAALALGLLFQVPSNLCKCTGNLLIVASLVREACAP